MLDQQGYARHAVCAHAYRSNAVSLFVFHTEEPKADYYAYK